MEERRGEGFRGMWTKWGKNILSLSFRKSRVIMRKVFLKESEGFVIKKQRKRET